jgi:hypothetical protein
MSKMDMIERSATHRAGLDVISGLADLYDNGSDVMEDLASDAIWNDRAAYWTTAKGGDADARRLCQMLNADVNMNDALAEIGVKPLSTISHSDLLRESSLTTLIPLNPKAADEIRKARGL